MTRVHLRVTLPRVPNPTSGPALAPDGRARGSDENTNPLPPLYRVTGTEYYLHH